MDIIYLLLGIFTIFIFVKLTKTNSKYDEEQKQIRLKKERETKEQENQARIQKEQRQAENERIRREFELYTQSEQRKIDAKQQQERIQKENQEYERLAEINRQEQIAKERQLKVAEQERHNAEQNRKATEILKIFIEEQRQDKQRFNSPIEIYKTNWKDFQRVFQQNNVIKLYHFTDSRNLSSIRQNGGLYSWWKAEELKIEVPMPGGVGFGRDLDRRYGLQNYVRLCFTKQHPMLYIAQREGRVLNPVILEIKLDVSYFKETRFSNMNATKTGHKQGLLLEDLKRIRFDLVMQPNHFDISDNEKHFYQAEVLVLEKIPIEFITNINSV